MEAGRPFNLAGPRAIPRLIAQEHNSPRKSNARTVAAEPRRKDLAPVKTSRKRHSSSHQYSNTPTNNTALYGLSQNIKRERRRGRLTQSDPFTFPSNALYASRTGNPLPRPLSRLESLPTEILEEVFFWTLTFGVGGVLLSFPRASLPIGRKLSSDFVRRGLFLRMCSGSQPIKSNKDDQTTRASQNELVKTQSWILRQQWLNCAFIRECIPNYMVSIIVREMAKHKLHWLDSAAPLVSPRLEPAISDYISDRLGQSPASPSALGTQYIEHQWVEPEHPMRHVMLGLNPPTGFISLQIHESNEIPRVGPDGLDEPPFHARWSIMSLNSATQIPPHLLHGPWTVPKIELLELIVRGGATVDWIHTTAGEVAEHGFLDALRENNARALRALCICDNDTTPGERKDATYANISSRGVGVVPEQKHLLKAIEQGCQEDVVETLLHAPKSQCDLQAAEVVQEIYQMEKKGWLARAEWLAERRDDDRIHRMWAPTPRVSRNNDDWLRGALGR